MCTYLCVDIYRERHQDKYGIFEVLFCKCSFEIRNICLKFSNFAGPKKESAKRSPLTRICIYQVHFYYKVLYTHLRNKLVVFHAETKIFAESCKPPIRMNISFVMETDKKSSCLDQGQQVDVETLL